MRKTNYINPPICVVLLFPLTFSIGDKPLEVERFFFGKGHRYDNCLTFLNDDLIATGGNMQKGGGIICLWKFGKKEPVMVIKNIETRVNCLAKTKDPNVLLQVTSSSFTEFEGKSYDSQRVITWDIGKRKIITSADFRGNTCFDISPGGKYLALNNFFGQLHPKNLEPKGVEYDRTSATVHEIATGKQIMVLKGHDPWIRNAKFTPDGKKIVTVSGYYELFFWDLKDKKKGDVLKSWEGFRYLAFSPDGRYLFSSGTDEYHRGRGVRFGIEKILQWDLATKKVVRFFCVNHVFLMEVSPDSKTLATVNGRHIWLFNTQNGQQIAFWQADQVRVTGLAFSPDGKMLASSGEQGLIRVWKAP